MKNQLIIEHTFNSILDRIKNGIYHDTNLKIYDIHIIKKMVSYYETIEEYEKCNLLCNYIKKRFEHENNYER